MESLDVRDYETLRPSLEPAVRHLHDRGLISYPTETVYGLGCLLEEEPLGALMRAKGRGPDRPMLVLVGSTDDVVDLDWTPEARSLAEVFWPGAVTLVLSDPRGVLPETVHGPSGGVGVRVSPHPVVRDLLRALGRPVASTSVNPAGEPAASSPEAVGSAVSALGLGHRVLFLDAGELPPAAPSTVIDCTRPSSVVIREGTVSIGRIRCVLPEIRGRA